MTASTANDVDLFFLVLISSGLDTAYELKSRAGLSLGSTLPVLKRLSEAGLIEGSDPGLRRARRFRITKKGDKKLHTESQELLGRRPASIEEALRAAYVGWTQIGSGALRTFVTRAADHLSLQASHKAAESDRLHALYDMKPSAERFRWLKLRSEAAELEANAAVLRQVMAELFTFRKPKSRRRR